jgi:hypothetical protein
MRQQVDVLEVKTLDVKAPILARTLGSKPQAWALQTDNPQLWPRWGSTASPGAYRLCLYPHHTRTSSCTAQRRAASAGLSTAEKVALFRWLFPNQHSLPKGGLCNLIALLLQKRPRENGCSVFVDAELAPLCRSVGLSGFDPADMAAHDIEPAIVRATCGVHPLDVSFIDAEDLGTPLERPSLASNKLAENLPESLTVTLTHRIFFEKAQLPQPLANRLIRLAAFQNPAFYKAQAMRRPVWNKPRVTGCAENFPGHIALPRGCLDATLSLLRDHGIDCALRDERHRGVAMDVVFIGTLRVDQETAVAAMLRWAPQGCLPPWASAAKSGTVAWAATPRCPRSAKRWKRKPTHACLLSYPQPEAFDIAKRGASI